MIIYKCSNMICLVQLWTTFLNTVPTFLYHCRCYISDGLSNHQGSIKSVSIRVDDFSSNSVLLLILWETVNVFSSKSITLNKRSQKCQVFHIIEYFSCKELWDAIISFSFVKDGPFSACKLLSNRPSYGHVWGDVFFCFFFNGRRSTGTALPIDLLGTPGPRFLCYRS